jgi:hypothetical protein
MDPSETFLRPALASEASMPPEFTYVGKDPAARVQRLQGSRFCMRTRPVPCIR